MPKIKEEDFNTMQQMFATQNPNGQNIGKSTNGAFDFSAMQQILSTQNPKGNLQNIEQSKIGIATNFETMQQLYQTQVGQKGNQEQDFSTMQNLFATCNGQNKQFQPSIIKMNNEDQQQTQNAQNFNTMQYLFATNAAQVMGAKQNQPLSEHVNNQDFSTMANLFKTNNHLQNTTNGTENNTN